MVNLLFDFNVSSEISSMDRSLMIIVIDFWKKVDLTSAVEDKSWMFYGRMMDLPETDNFGRKYTIVKEKVRNFFVTENVREDAILIVKPIGLLICEWLEFNSNVSKFDVTEFFKSLIFKSAYFLDYSSSIDSWVEKCKDSTRLCSLFSKACYFCIENKVIFISNKLRRRYSLSRLIMNPRGEIFHLYWIHKLKDNIPIFIEELKNSSTLNWIHWIVRSEEFLEVNVNWLMLRFSILNGNPHGVKYFYNALTYEQKRIFLPKCLIAASLSEIDNFSGDPKFVYILEFLYAEMEASQRLHFLNGNKRLFVQLIAKYWQCQIQAVPIIEMSWDEIDVEFYHFIIQKIVRRIAEGRYVKEHLLKSIWKITPDNMRREFFSLIVESAHCIEIFSNRVVVETEQILRDATAVERNKILSFYEV